MKTEKSISKKNSVKEDLEMTDKLEKVEGTQFGLTVPNCHFSSTSLEIEGSIDSENFIKVGIFLHHVRTKAKWLVGDWINYAKTSSKLSKVSGVKKMLATFYAEGSLRNDAYVASRIERSRRRENLSFSHHQEVAPLPPEKQDYWLNKAETEKYTVKDLRKEKAWESLKNALPAGYFVSSGSKTYKSRCVRYQRYLKTCTQRIKSLQKEVIGFYGFSMDFHSEFKNIENTEMSQRASELRLQFITLVNSVKALLVQFESHKLIKDKVQAEEHKEAVTEIKASKEKT